MNKEFEEEINDEENREPDYDIDPRMHGFEK